MGAGIAGLSAAILLKQFSYRTLLIEKSKIGTHIGGGIDIHPNGVKELFALGVEPQLRRQTQYNGRTITIGLPAGETIQTIPLERFEKNSRYPLMSFLRQDLIKILFEAALADEIYEEQEVSHFHHSETSIALVLKNNKQLKGDLLVAADGINSIVRRQLFPQAQKAFLGHLSFGGRVSNKFFKHNYIHGLQRTCVVFPCTKNECHTVMFCPKPQWWRDHNFHNKEEQMALFRNRSEEVTQIVDHLAEENRFCVESYETPPLEKFAFPRLFLIGDAAHALSPLGALATSLALEDIGDLRLCLEQDLSYDEIARFYNLRSQPRAKKYRDFSRNVLLPPIVSHGPKEYQMRIERLSSLQPHEVFSSLTELTQGNLVSTDSMVLT